MEHPLENQPEAITIPEGFAWDGVDQGNDGRPYLRLKKKESEPAEWALVALVAPGGGEYALADLQALIVAACDEQLAAPPVPQQPPEVAEADASKHVDSDGPGQGALGVGAPSAVDGANQPEEQPTPQQGPAE